MTDSGQSFSGVASQHEQFAQAGHQMPFELAFMRQQAIEGAIQPVVVISDASRNTRQSIHANQTSRKRRQRSRRRRLNRIRDELLGVDSLEESSCSRPPVIACASAYAHARPCGRER